MLTRVSLAPICFFTVGIFPHQSILNKKRISADVSQKILILVLFVGCGITAAAQTNVTTTNGGTAGTVPYFTSKSNIEPSLISQSSGTVSIAGPLATSGQLLVSGQVISEGTGAGFRVLGSSTDEVNGAPWYGVGAGTLNLYAGGQNAVQVAGFFGLDFETANGLMVIRGDNGNVGIGTTAPMGKFDVNGAGGFVVSDTNLDPSAGYSLSPLENSGKLLIGWNRSAGGGEQDLISNRSAGGTGGFNFWDYTNSGVLNSLVTMQGSGNVGIGTTAPGAKLEVVGNLKLTGSGASMTYQDGSVQSVAWNGVLSGGDYAESVDVIGDRTQYEPGDVMVIDPHDEGKFLKSAKPYSTAVMGIYSTRPGVVGRRQLSDKSHMKEEVPMAMVGVVPTKVSAEGGAIVPGDLLVTSSKPGYAMKGTDHSLMMGAIIGKSLGHLETGTGLVEVAVSLQ